MVLLFEVVVMVLSQTKGILTDWLDNNVFDNYPDTPFDHILFYMASLRKIFILKWYVVSV